MAMLNEGGFLDGGGDYREKAASAKRCQLRAAKREDISF